MTSLAHYFGQDLSANAGGDLLLASGDTETTQAVIRRLLTNPGDYIQQPSYGAGLGQFVGQPNAATRIAAVARQQMKMEADVLQTPPPVITIESDNISVVILNIAYTSASTGGIMTLRLPVS